MVLLIVLLILMMTTATATFAMHSTGYEIQAAGSMRQALRTRNVSDGAANGWMLHLSGQNCLEADRRQQEAGASFFMNVEKYGFPNVVGESQDILDRLYVTDLAWPTSTGVFENTPVPDDSTLASSATAAAYAPSANAVLECFELDTAPSGNGKLMITYRARVTVFGEMAPATDSNETGAMRSDHETVSISRFYMNVTAVKPNPSE